VNVEGSAAGRLYVVGIGPGDHANITHRAEQVLRQAACVIGYDAYVDLVRAWLPEQQYLPSPITFEQQRAEEAIARARQGQIVALIGSGDAGVYGLAGLVLELLARSKDDTLLVEVVPGVTAALSAAALLGAPLGHDFAAVSLSDLLTPSKVILKRLRACAEADFVTVLYNPASRTRRKLLREAIAIFLACRSGATPVGLVSNAYRDGQTVAISTLGAFDPEAAGMQTTIVIGNSSTLSWQHRMITPRGYPGTRPVPVSDEAG
jgi:precorrin-3B C17-methyltransferase